MIEKLRQHRFIAIFRNIPDDKLLKCVRAVYNGGVRIFEITYNPSDSDTVKRTAQAFYTVKSEFGDAVTVGAGTVVFPEYVSEAKKAGAEFIVSPDTNERVIKLTHENGMLSIPGAFTPNEITNAYRLGADVVKIFPILPDNIAYLRTILSPLSYIPFIPTGGVNPQTVKSFLQLGATAVASGATVLTPDAVEKEDYRQIEQNARAHINLVKQS